MTFPSPLGNLIAMSSHNKLIGLSFEEKEISGQLPSSQFSFEEILPAKKPVLEQTRRWFIRYFLGESPSPLELSLMPEGTPFQKEVWEELLKIPYGEVVSYSEIAERIARNRGIPRMSPQAVGQAVKRNPIAIIIPCHRVVGALNKLGGYNGGVAKKRLLLEIEGRKQSFWR